MGTRSLTFVYDSYKDEAGNTVHEPIINMYRQYDGYPTGHGAELAEFLAQFTMVNGLGINETRKVANGMGCLAAQLIANFKDGAGQFYLYPVTAKDCGQDYEYHIYQDGASFRVAVTDRGCNFFGLSTSDKDEILFHSDLAEFKEFCAEKETA